MKNEEDGSKRGKSLDEDISFLDYEETAKEKIGKGSRCLL
jgi:hypothetical protein